MRRLNNIFRLGIKELFSLRRDVVLFSLIVWSFTFAIYAAATGVAHDLNNASIAFVDEDRSQLSLRLREALLPPYFNEPVTISPGEIDAAMARATNEIYDGVRR